MGKLIIDLMSDTHNQHGKFKLEGGDILLHSGDFTGRGSASEVQQFMLWLELQDYSHKVVIPGNHDWDLEKNFPYWRDEFAKRGIHLLNDSGVTLRGIQDGDGEPYEIKVWGSPVQPWFHSWAFNRARTEREATRLHGWIKPHWDMIPEDTEILLTHGPAYGILDQVVYPHGLHVGCEELAKRIEQIKSIDLHVSGHIHEGRGFTYKGSCTYVNASSLNEMYAIDDNRPLRATREVVQDGSVVYVL